MTALLDRIRYRPERVLIDELFERFGLDKVIEHHESTIGPAAHEFVLGTQLRLTPILAPRLCNLLLELQDKLGFDEPTELFVQADAAVNAFAIHTLAEGMPHMVSLTSGLVELMSDDELRFVLGHELGHLHFRHYRARMIYGAVGETDQGESRLPALLKRRMETWERLAELSADRVGFTAAEGRLEPIVSAFFKMSSGLGPEHLHFDIDAFLSQLEDLRKLKRREVLAQFSHPVTPVRVRSLQLYGERGGSGMADEELVDVDGEVAAIAQLMEHEVSEPLEVQGRDFLLSAGLLAAPHLFDYDLGMHGVGLAAGAAWLLQPRRARRRRLGGWLWIGAYLAVLAYPAARWLHLHLGVLVLGAWIVWMTLELRSLRLGQGEQGQ